MVLFPGCGCCCDSIGTGGAPTRVEIDLAHSGERYCTATLRDYVYQSRSSPFPWATCNPDNPTRQEYGRLSLAAYMKDLAGTYVLNNAGLLAYRYDDPNGYISLNVRQFDWNSGFIESEFVVSGPQRRLMVDLSFRPRAGTGANPPTKASLIALPVSESSTIYQPRFVGSLHKVCDLSLFSTFYEVRDVGAVANENNLAKHGWAEGIGGVSMVFGQGCALPVTVTSRFRYQGVSRGLYSVAQNFIFSNTFCPTPNNGNVAATGPHDVEVSSTFDSMTINHNYKGSGSDLRDAALPDVYFDSVVTINSIRLVYPNGNVEAFGGIGQTSCPSASNIP